MGAGVPSHMVCGGGTKAKNFLIMSYDKHPRFRLEASTPHRLSL
jgi:hypothetical protein